MKRWLITFLMIFNIIACKEAFATDVVIEKDVTTAACIGDPINNIESGFVDYIADWTPISYTVEFDRNVDGEIPGVDYIDMSSVEFDYDEQNRKLPASIYTREGFDFIGWCRNTRYCLQTENAFEEDKAPVLNWTTENNGLITLYAQWQPTCVVKLHMGQDILCLYKNKISADGMPSLAVRVEDQVYYAGMSPASINKVIHTGSTTKLKVKYDGEVYNVHDLTVP